jgi:hypothetical protein
VKLSGTFHADDTLSGELDFWSPMNALCAGALSIRAKRSST